MEIVITADRKILDILAHLLYNLPVYRFCLSTLYITVYNLSPSLTSFDKSCNYLYVPQEC